MASVLFIDRTDAGRRLARLLTPLAGEDVVVLGLPRGGVPVAFEVARGLRAPLDLIIVRKLGVPFQPELGMGAIGEDGVRVLDDRIVRAAGVTATELATVEARERAELERRAERYRRGRSRVSLTGRTAVVVDDGLATGSTARAACHVARRLGAARVVLAVPVGSATRIDAARADADDVVCVATPEYFMAIGEWYRDFSQVSDEEVVALLDRAAVAIDEPLLPRAVAVDDAGRDHDVDVTCNEVRLPGHLTIPPAARGLVLFAHGSGSSRHSGRNRYVASALNRAGIGVLLFDLLTPAEELDRANVFDVELLASRLVGAIDWIRDNERDDLPLALFGASTGAAAALWAAADLGTQVSSVVSRGGRPDLASARLGDVTAPTLLIVGGEDHVVLGLNRVAQAEMRSETRLAVVQGATHLFEEPGALTQVAHLARVWFLDHFPRAVDAEALQDETLHGTR